MKSKKKITPPTHTLPTIVHITAPDEEGGPYLAHNSIAETDENEYVGVYVLQNVGVHKAAHRLE